MPPAPTPPLIERDGALSQLAADLALAARAEGRTVLLNGEAGIGKTSLLEQFVRDGAAQVAQVMWGACEALHTPRPLGPLHDMARRAPGRLRELLADGTDRGALFDAVLDALGTPPAPTLLVFEDIHWADAATLDLIRFVGRRIHRLPALMVLSYRDDELDATHLLHSVLGHLPPRHATRLVLQRLSPAAVAHLAGRSARDAAGLYAATGGNPFFVTEVLASPDGDVPATVREAVLGRAAVLDADARAVLDLAAIVPRAIEVALVDAIVAAPVKAVERCLASGLLLADGRVLRFRHELARVAVEASIPRPRARALHARVLASLSEASSGRPASLARLVHHAHRAEDGAAVLRLAPQAAHEAMSRGARREAAAHCRVALAYAEALSDVDRATLLDDYADHCFELGDLAASIPAREEAIDLLERIGDAARLCDSLARHAMPLVRSLRNAEADAVSRRAVEIAEALGPGPQLARAFATEAYLRMLNRDYLTAIEWGEKAIALAERFADARTLASAWNSVGAALLFVDYPRGCEAIRTSLAVARGLDDGGVGVADAYVMLGSGSGEVHEFVDAERHLQEGIAFARAHDLDRLAGYMEAWQALVDLYRGRWELAGERANLVVDREVLGSTNRLMALVALGRLRTRRGDPGATPVLDEALALAVRSGTLQRVAPVRCTRAEGAWLRGDREAVEREARPAFELALAKGHPWFLGELAYWLWKVDALAVVPDGCAAPYASQMRGQWADAAAAWSRLGCPYEEASALAEGDEAAQREALAAFDRLGANAMAQSLRRSMRDAGVQAVPRGPRETTRGNAAWLTARELQVLALVAEGRQNAQIATRLSRSTRTIEHHVASILAKLDAGSRAEAVEVARRQGLLSQDG